MPSEHEPSAAFESEQCCTARLQMVADACAAFVWSIKNQRAQGKPIDPEMVLASYHGSGEALATALRRGVPVDPEFSAAIASLQEQREAIRELLP